MVNRCSKSLHFGRKSWGEFEKPTPEVLILGTVCHLDSICGVFQQTLLKSHFHHLTFVVAYGLQEHQRQHHQLIQLLAQRFYLCCYW